MHLDHIKYITSGGEDGGYDFGGVPITEHYKFNNFRTRNSDLTSIYHTCGFETVLKRDFFDVSEDGLRSPYEDDHDKAKLEFCEHCGWWLISRTITHSLSRKAYKFRNIQYSGVPMSFEERSSPAVSEIANLISDGHKHLRHTSPKLLEVALAEIFKNYYNAATVNHVGGPNDQGIDIYAVISEHTFLIQVKRRTNGKAESVATVRDLLGAHILAEDRMQMQGFSSHILTSAPKISPQAESTLKQISLNKYGFDITAHAFDELSEIIGFATGDKNHKPWEKIIENWEPFQECTPEIIPHNRLHQDEYPLGME